MRRRVVSLMGEVGRKSEVSLRVTCIHGWFSAVDFDSLEVEHSVGELHAGGEDVHQETARAHNPPPAALGVVMLSDGGSVHVMPPQRRHRFV